MMLERSQPAYQSLWWWFLCGLPALSLVGSGVLIFQAYQNSYDIMCSQKMRAHVAHLEYNPMHFASDLDLGFTLLWDGTQLVIQQFSGQPQKGRLYLSLYHSTYHAPRSFWPLYIDKPSSFYGEWVARMPFNKDWVVILEDAERTWRIRKVIAFPRKNIEIRSHE